MNHGLKVNGDILEITLPEEVHINRVVVNRQIFSQRMQVCESCKYHGLEGHEEPCVSCEVGSSKYLPSAEPQITRCKDCRWWDKSEDSPFGYCMAMKHGYMTANWEIGIYRRYKGDFYCADAERRTDGN